MRDTCFRARSAVVKAMLITRGQTVSIWRVAPNFVSWPLARALARAGSHVIPIAASGSL
jgi:hypothetical protein